MFLYLFRRLEGGARGNTIYAWHGDGHRKGQYRTNKRTHERVGTGLAPVRESVACTRFRTGASPVPTRSSTFSPYLNSIAVPRLFTPIQR